MLLPDHSNICRQYSPCGEVQVSVLLLPSYRPRLSAKCVSPRGGGSWRSSHSQWREELFPSTLWACCLCLALLRSVVQELLGSLRPIVYPRSHGSIGYPGMARLRRSYIVLSVLQVFGTGAVMEPPDRPFFWYLSRIWTPSTAYQSTLNPRLKDFSPKGVINLPLR